MLGEEGSEPSFTPGPPRAGAAARCVLQIGLLQRLAAPRPLPPTAAALI